MNVTWYDVRDLSDLALLEKVGATVARLDWPDEVFDPTNATSSDFTDRHLPPPPDPLLRPRLSAAWHRIFSAPFRLAQPVFDPPISRQRLAAQRTPLSGLLERSRNWSGASVAPYGGNHFTEIVGLWSIPTQVAPADGGAAPGQPYRCAAFIGFDGQGLAFNASMPQIGTMHEVTDGGGGPSKNFFAWWWWWWPGQQPTPPIPLTNMPLAEGDVIACWITVLTPTLVRFLILNLTQNIALAPWDYPAPWVLHDGTLVQVQVSGNTAEWILERPTPAFGMLDPFPDFGTITFTDCVSSAAPAPAQPGVDQDLAGATLIEMYEVRQNPPRTAVIAAPARPDDSTVTVEHQS